MIIIIVVYLHNFPNPTTCCISVISCYYRYIPRRILKNHMLLRHTWSTVPSSSKLHVTKKPSCLRCHSHASIGDVGIGADEDLASVLLLLLLLLKWFKFIRKLTVRADQWEFHYYQSSTNDAAVAVRTNNLFLPIF